jgi:preprotein translocase subunit SecD
MQIRSRSFNIYLALAATAGLLCACQSPEKKRIKSETSLRVHIEAQNPIPDRTRQVSVFRQAPIQLYIEPNPFLNEEYVKDARVVETYGGFALRIELNRSGRNLAEQYTTGNLSRRLAIFAHFADPTQMTEEKPGVGRWLAAPRIAQSITNGMLVFTPDATRAEADQIALGLRNAAKKMKSTWRYSEDY